MKLSLIGFETSMPTIGFGSRNNMLNGFSVVPSSDLPQTTYVGFILWWNLLCLSAKHVGGWIFFYFWVSVWWVLERSCTDGEACERRNNHTCFFFSKVSWSLLILVLREKANQSRLPIEMEKIEINQGSNRDGEDWWY